jgi:hypothetical protein
LTRILAAAGVLILWLAVRHRRPGLRFALPVAVHAAWRFLVPLGALALAATASGPAAVLLAVLFTAVRMGIGRSLGHLRRSVAVEFDACLSALTAAGRPTTLPDVAVCVLLQRFAARGMGRVEAVALAGRCAHLDDLGAQVALQEGGMAAYAAYLRRFGRAGEVTDPEVAVHGDRFPGGPPAG